MPRGEVSRADTALIQALAAQNLAVSPYQLERWRAAGQLPRNRRRGLGRGKGSVSELDDQVVRQAAVLARSAGQGRALMGSHVLDRFMAGRPVAEEKVRAAYRDRLDRLGRLIAADAGDDDEGWQARFDAAQRLSRRAHRADTGMLLDALLERPERYTASEREQRRAVRALTQGMAHGGDAAPEEMAEAFAVFGAAPGGSVESAKLALREAELAGETAADEIAHALSLRRYREVLDEVPYELLRRAVTIYAEAMMYQSIVTMAGMWSIAAESNGDPETVAPGFREIDRAAVEQMVEDPVFRSWGASQDPFMRNPRDTVVLGSLGLVQVPELLCAVEGYRDRLKVLHERFHRGVIEAEGARTAESPDS